MCYCHCIVICHASHVIDIVKEASHDFSEGTSDLSQAPSGGLELRVGVHGLEIGPGSTNTENAYNDGYETHIIKVSRSLLGSVWLYESWFPQITSDYGYKLGSALLITMGKQKNCCEIIYRS